jgi:hypothetical protein
VATQKERPRGAPATPHERIVMLHTISFLAVVAVILLTGCVVLVLESGGHPPGREQEPARLSDEPGDA